MSMEGLTIRNNVGRDVLKSPVVCGRCGEIDYSPITECGEDIAKHLAAYEETDLEPDLVQFLAKLYRNPSPNRLADRRELALYRALGAVEKLTALVEAKKEGRLVMLDMPRKPFAWGDDEHETCLCPDCGEDLMGLYDGERMVLQCPACGQYLDATKAITRAEADAVLSGGDNG